MASEDTSARILEAARSCLLADGYAAMSTRKVAVAADVPLSQIHYHFGSKDALILQLLHIENVDLVDRQAEMFEQDLPLWKRWDLACDFLDQDLDSGYVRVLQEMMAAGWSSDAIAGEVTTMLNAWSDVLTKVAREARDAGIDLGPFEPEEITALVGSSFLGAESMILLGVEGDRFPLRRALRRVGEMIRAAEEQTP